MARGCDLNTKANGRTGQMTRLAVRLSGAGLFTLADKAMNGAYREDKAPLLEELKKLPNAVAWPIFKEIQLGMYDERDERQKGLF